MKASPAQWFIFIFSSPFVLSFGNSTSKTPRWNSHLLRPHIQNCLLHSLPTLFKLYLLSSSFLSNLPTQALIIQFMAQCLGDVLCFWVESEDLISSQFSPHSLSPSPFSFALFLLSCHSLCSNSFLYFVLIFTWWQERRDIGQATFHQEKKRRSSSLNLKIQKEKDQTGVSSPRALFFHYTSVFGVT